MGRSFRWLVIEGPGRRLSTFPPAMVVPRAYRMVAHADSQQDARTKMAVIAKRERTEWHRMIRRCQSKKTYGSRMKALAGGAFHAGKNGRLTLLEAYRCLVCSQFHLATKMRGKR